MTVVHHLSSIRADAFTQMAIDLVALEEYAAREAFRFRHYSWSNPCLTFGYGQCWQWVRQQSADGNATICRRPTGGGVVHHQCDWTYSLVIPSATEPAGLPPHKIYGLVHQAVVNALYDLGMATELAGCPGKAAQRATATAGNDLCFAAPAPLDVIMKKTGLKLAGAAMKRNRAGLLLQGSLNRSAAPAFDRWEELETVFAKWLANLLQAEGPPISCRVDRLPGSAISRRRDTIASSQWQQRR